MNNKSNNSKQNFKRRSKRKVCNFCERGIEQVDYKDVKVLEKYINSICKIIPKRTSGCCQKHQRRVSNAIKRARIVALLPFIKE